MEPGSSETVSRGSIDPNAVTAPAAGTARGSEAEIGPRLGDFQIVREIARGGMGVVYEAVQCSLGRRVALKVLLPGVAIGTEALQRFQREARAAGGLQHQHIVPVYATGESNGVPFLAMQYIEGRSLAAVVRELRERNDAPDAGHFRSVARWAQQAAEALAYAHGHGVVHRDIKPANLLLDGADQVWVTDFGLARQDSSVTITLSGDVLGTVRYMSPEQARGAGRVDERTDIYSLGVSLYELLSLRPPFDGPDRESTLKQVLLDEPAPLRRRVPRLPRGLATIVHKAMEKEPERRYASAALLAEDLRRFQAGRPLLAQPPGPLEQVGRLIARHKLICAFIVALFATISGFAGWMTVLYARAHRLQQTAEEQRNRALAARDAEREVRLTAESIQKFLESIFNGIDPAEARGRDTALLKEVLDRAARRVDTELAGQPVVQAAIRSTIGWTYLKLATFDEAEPHLVFAYDTRRQLLGPEHRDTLRALGNLGGLRWKQGRNEEAETLLREGVTAAKRTLGPGDEVTRGFISNLAMLLDETGHLDEAEKLEGEVLELERAALGPEDPKTLLTLVDYGWAMFRNSNPQGGEPLLREGAARLTAKLGEDAPDALVATQMLAVVLHAQGKLDEAEPLYRRTLELRRRVLGPEHPQTIDSIEMLSGLLTETGRLEEAEPLSRQALDASARTMGPEHPRTLTSMQNLAELLDHRDKDEEAEALYRQALTLSRRVLGETHVDTALVMIDLALLAEKRGQLDEAEQLAGPAQRIIAETLGPEHENTLWASALLAGLAGQRGQVTEAASSLRDLLGRTSQSLGETHPRAVEMRRRLARLLAANDAGDEALELTRAGVAACERDLGAENPATVGLKTDLAQLLIAGGQPAEALGVLDTLLEKTGEPVEDATRSAAARELRAAALSALGRFAEAEQDLLASYEAHLAAAGPADRHTRDVADRLVELYEKCGKPAEASAWRAKGAAR